MLQHPAAVRAAFEEAGRTLLRTLRAITPDQWDRPGALGDWTTRELAAHALRAFVTVEAYLAAEPMVDRLIGDAAEYYAVALADPSVHHGVAVRGREAGRQLIDPLGEAEATITRVTAQIAALADDEPVNCFAGQMTLVEYLATRVVEAGVHTLDLQRATGQFLELHPDTSAVAIAVLTELAPATTLILALTGRAPLPAGFNALG